ncbi:MAG: hypothetical protein SVY10_08505 [Thermodesulfobacteriota bacterium]|nr:hypothetical protein [Thermodesulfobacteriota bacterium]
MEEKKVNEKEKDDQEKGRKPEEKIPFCTTAPSAEHSRASDDDEPCDDSRAGDS